MGGTVQNSGAGNIYIYIYMYISSWWVNLKMPHNVQRDPQTGLDLCFLAAAIYWNLPESGGVGGLGTFLHAERHICPAPARGVYSRYPIP